MNTIQKIEHWAEDHQHTAIDFGRILLGLFLFIKGVYFLEHWEVLYQLAGSFSKEEVLVIIVHYVAFSHLAGGILIALGLATRISAAFQIPILIGAVTMVNYSTLAFGTEWWTALSVLIGLFFYLIYGSGKLSVDHWSISHKES